MTQFFVFQNFIVKCILQKKFKISYCVDKFKIYLHNTALICFNYKTLEKTVHRFKPFIVSAHCPYHSVFNCLEIELLKKYGSH